jgi:hypothetical protein
MAVAVGTPTLGQLRQALEAARAAGWSFEEAWSSLADDFMDVDARDATALAWKRAYCRVPATAGDEAVGRLAALVDGAQMAL